MTETSEKVVVAYLTDGRPFGAFMESLLNLVIHDMAYHRRIVNGGGRLAFQAGANLSGPRNMLVKEFLENSDADWLWMVDTDMTFPPDTVERLLEFASPDEAPIVGGLCFGFDEHGDIQPTLYGLVGDEDDPQVIRYHEWPENTMWQVAATGGACLLMHRTALEKIRDIDRPNCPGKHGFNDAYTWFQETEHDGRPVGEDITFCWRAGLTGIPVYVNTGVQLGHIKSQLLDLAAYEKQRKESQPELVVISDAPPTWDVPRYAAIPTHDRPARLLSLVASLGAQCDTIAIVDNASTPPVDVDKLKAAVPARVAIEVIRDEEQPPNLARIWNVLLDRCTELAKDNGHDTWDVAVFNDDAVLPAGWYDAVAIPMRDHPTAIVAFTDTFAVHSDLTLLTEIDMDLYRRMCPWAFVTRGELGLRADESMRWWFFDNDFDFRARQSGGALSVPGPKVTNAQAKSSTVGELAKQAKRDQATFNAKWLRS